MASASRMTNADHELERGLNYFESREVKLLLEEDNVEAAKKVIGDEKLADQILPTTSEDIAEEVLYMHQLQQENVSGREYWNAKESLKSTAEAYLKSNGLEESIAEKHANELAVNVRIGHTYEAIDTVRAWSSIINESDF